MLVSKIAYRPSGRIGFLCEQAHRAGFHFLGVQDSTSKPARYTSEFFHRLVAGYCPRLKKSIEFWACRQLPLSDAKKGPVGIDHHDVTLISEGHGFAIFRVKCFMFAADVCVLHLRPGKPLGVWSGCR